MKDQPSEFQEKDIDFKPVNMTYTVFYGIFIQVEATPYHQFI